MDAPEKIFWAEFVGTSGVRRPYLDGLEYEYVPKEFVTEQAKRIAELEATLFSAQQALLSEGVRSGVIERERDAARKRVAELEDVNLAARRRLESLEVSMGEKMPLGAHAALSCLREKG